MNSLILPLSLLCNPNSSSCSSNLVLCWRLFYRGGHTLEPGGSASGLCLSPSVPSHALFGFLALPSLWHGDAHCLSVGRWSPLGCEFPEDRDSACLVHTFSRAEGSAQHTAGAQEKTEGLNAGCHSPPLQICPRLKRCSQTHPRSLEKSARRDRGTRGRTSTVMGLGWGSFGEMEV